MWIFEFEDPRKNTEKEKAETINLMKLEISGLPDFCSLQRSILRTSSPSREPNPNKMNIMN